MRIVFHCFGAWVGQITGAQVVAWWPFDPIGAGFPAPRLIPIDLAKNPTAARAGTISPQDIQCDDNRAQGGLNSLGPLFPGGQMIGACWVTENYLSTLGANMPQRGSADAYDYESMMTMYFQGELGDRTFNGFHARWLQDQGSLSLVEIWNGGTGKHGQPAGQWWLDLRAVSDPTYTTISPANPTGALFLDRQTTTSLALYYIKRPAGLGYDAFGPLE